MMSKQAALEAATLRAALAPRASEFVDAHVLFGVRAGGDEIVYYTAASRATVGQQRLIEDAILGAAVEIQRQRAESRKRRGKKR